MRYQFGGGRSRIPTSAHPRTVTTAAGK